MNTQNSSWRKSLILITSKTPRLVEFNAISTKDLTQIGDTVSLAAWLKARGAFHNCRKLVSQRQDWTLDT
jgi:hypothetical protein